MPLNQFFSGDYTSPLEAAFGAKAHRVGSQKGAAPAAEAIESVSKLQDALKEIFGLASVWDDSGETKGEQFDYGAFNALRAFAAHQEYPRMTGVFRKKPIDFNPYDDSSAHPGLLKIWKGAKTRFRHLIQHADNQGFWFPVDFEHPINLNQKTGLFAGSSIRLLSELNELRSIIGLTKSWTDLADDETVADESDPMATIKYACALMFAYADLSCERRLPIVFDG
ncbi:hypothetical protein [Prosthecobacter sp.]|uniref:hypothetical protein n=1 Tax=Prosthecobacter sp. TaxID=1965333 RepID=UPI002606456E|nr:hypothetical protein [Prosthecobacter sp.]